MPRRPALDGQARGGTLLILAAIAGLAAANLPGAARFYAAWLHHPLGPLDLHGWIDEALMALFLLLVGLEVKRE